MIRVSGVPNWAGSRMRTRPLGPVVELPLGHDPRKACAEFWVGGGMRRRPLGPQVELPVGHDPREACAEIDGVTPCEPSLWGRRWSSLWGVICVKGVPKWAGDTMRTLSLGTYVELLECTIRVRGVPK